MSWWNDLSTHRNASASGFDGAPRHASAAAAAFASPRERRAATPEHPGCASSAAIAGSFHPSRRVVSEDATWGTPTTQSDAPSLWQTATSAGISDQLGLSENSPIWGPQQQLPPQHTSVSPPPRGAEAFVGKGMLGDVVRPLSNGASRSSFNDSAAVLSAAVNGVSAVNVNAAGAPLPPRSCGGDGPGSCHAAEDRPHHASGGGGAAESGNDKSDDVDSDDASLYDDVDLGTISSLIASLQVHGALHEGEEEVGANTLRSNQGGETNRFATPTAASSLPPSAPVILIDHAASAGSRPHALFADPSSGSVAKSGSAAGDRSTASCGSPFAPAGVQPGGDTASIAPLHLTPSMLEGLLANFQTALKGRAAEVSTTSPMPQVADTELLHPDRYGSPEAQDDFAGGAMNSASDNNNNNNSGGGSAGLGRRGSPLMRSHVTSVVAHQLNMDSNLRGTPVQDFRRGVPASVGSGSSDPPTPVRQRGTSAPARRTHSHNHSSASQPPPSSTGQLGRHERAASPDSSIDRFFSQATPPVTSFALVHHLASGSTTEENAAAASHQHARTASEISLPAAASTYTGSGALHQHVDERGCITVVDPQRRKLHVPLSAIQTTKALNGRLKTPSLCLLFQSGRCRQGDNCYQVHVEPATVDRLRADVEAMPCCCLLHGDCNCHLVDPAVYEGRSLCIAGQFNVPLSRVAYTAGLQRVLQEETTAVAVNPSVLCRLHGQPGGCRFGADCKFIHVCCSILKNELAQVMSSAATAAATSTTTTTSASGGQLGQLSQQPSFQQQPLQQLPQQPQLQQHHLPPQRLGSSAPGSPSTFVHGHSMSGVMNLSLSNANMLPTAAAAMPRPMIALPTGPASGELSLSPPLPAQAARPVPSNGSPMLQELRQSNSSQLMGSPGAGANGAGLYNRNFVSTPRQLDVNSVSATNNNNNNNSSLVSSANFSPTQLAQAAPTMTASFSGAPMQTQPSSGGAPLFTVTTVQQARNSPAQSPAGRPAPTPSMLQQQQQQQMQPQLSLPPQQQVASGSVPGSPQLGYHLRTFSAQSAGPHHHPQQQQQQPYQNSSALAQTPNRSGAGSPMNAGLPAARSLPNMFGATSGTYAGPGGRSSGFSSPAQRQLLRQVTPPQSQPPPHHHHQHSTSQQFYVQQINQDGTVSFVPVNMVANLGG